MQNRFKRMLSLLIALIMVFSMIPLDVFAKDSFDSRLEDLLTTLYGGDEQRAKGYLESLREAGIIDESGRMVDLDVREDGRPVELKELAQRIVSGEETGAITVNGKTAEPSQIADIQQVSTLLDIIRLMDEDVKITDEHVANFQALVAGIVDGSIDLNEAIESGVLNLYTSGKKDQNGGTRGTQTGTGNVEAEGGYYTAPYISGSVYEAEHQFALTDPSNTAWYTEAVVSDAVVTLSCETTETAFTNNGTVTVTATLNKKQPVPVSFDWAAVSDTIPLTGDTSGTVTWAANENQLQKTFSVTLGTKASNWVGSHALVINAGNAINALFEGGKTFWTHTVSFTANDIAGIATEYPQVTTSNFSFESNYATYDNVNHTFRFVKLTDGQFPSSGRFKIAYSCQYGSSPYYVYLVSPNVNINTSNVTQVHDLQLKPYTRFSNTGAGYINETWFDNGYYTGEGSLEGTVVNGEVWLIIETYTRLQSCTVSYPLIMTSGEIVSVTVPEGTYYSGQVVPVTVTLEYPAVAPEGTTLTVNGVECPMLNAGGTEAKSFTFGYTVKDTDSAVLNVSALSDTFTNAYGDALTFESDFPTTTIGTSDGVTVSSSVKVSGLDWENARFGIDDAAPADQVVTVVIPFKAGANKTWVVNEAIEITPALSMQLPGYPNAAAEAYLSSAYFSPDGGATRYPVYVIGDNAEALAVRFAPAVNPSVNLRYDTLCLYLDTEVGTPVNYLGEWGDAQEDGMGFAFFAGGENAASVVMGHFYSYFVKDTIAFDPAETVNRPNYNAANVMRNDEGEPNGFYREGEGYVVLQDTTPNRQHDVELVADENLYQAVTRGIRVEEPVEMTLSWQITNRRNFSFTDKRFFTWTTSDPEIAVIEKDENTGAAHIVLVGKSGAVTLTLTVLNGSEANRYDLTVSMYVLEGLTPFLNVPLYSRERTTLTDTDTDVLFASNVTARNAEAGKTTTFTAKLYSVSAVNEEPAGDPVWQGSFQSTVTETVTHITVPGEQLPEPGIYALVIGTRFEGGAVGGTPLDAVDLSATAWLNVKQAPLKIKLNKLDSYSISYGALNSLGYTLTPGNVNATVEYTIQKSGETVGARTSASEGTIPFNVTKPEGLKDAYTITVYAKAEGEDNWSVDSMVLRVYNPDILDMVVADVLAGEIGGTTGGSGLNPDEINMDNHGKLAAYLNGSEHPDYQLTFDDFTTLRTDMSLQKLISVNYGSGVWGLLSDKMQWSSSNSDVVSVNYEQGGTYSDINNYSYTSYGPATDFLLVGKGETGEETVTITATHAATGITSSIQVSTTTLTDQLYVFQFMPKVTTRVVYTNGSGDLRELTTNPQGELAVYEPSGIASAVMAMSVNDDQTYVGTIFNNKLQSGERDIASLALYPCNNLRLRSISNVTLTFKNPNGSAYNGTVTLRAGVYKNGVYCPAAQTSLITDPGTHYNAQDDIVATVTDGKLTLGFDPTQFKNDPNNAEETGAYPTDKITYVIEYRVSGYQTNYVMLTVNTDVEGEQKPMDSVISLRALKGGVDVPQITRQTIQQYTGDTPVAYTRDVLDFTENIGISKEFNKVVLTTEFVLPPTVVSVDAQGHTTLSGEFAFYTVGGHKLTGQTEYGSSEADQIIDLSDLENSILFVFPFSSSPIGRHVYTMTNDNLEADGITDQGADPTPSSRVKAMFVQDGIALTSTNLPFGISNMSHQVDLTDPNAGAAEMGTDVKNNLKGQVSVSSIFSSINVNEMLQKGFAFLSGIACGGADMPINLMILPTEDPGIFRIVVFIGEDQPMNQGNDDGFDLSYSSQERYEDYKGYQEFQKFNEQGDNDDDDDDDDDGGDVSYSFNFSGTVILEAGVNLNTGKWKVEFCGGSVGLGFSIKYEWSQNFFCGPVPVTVSLEVGAHLKVKVSFVSKAAAKAMLLDATVGVYIKAFAGIGSDFSFFKFKLGIYGEISADVNFLYLQNLGGGGSTGTKLDIAGEIGIRLEIKILFVKYNHTLASTGFGWTKKWNNYDQIKQQWASLGFADLRGTTESGRDYVMRLYPDGTAMVAVEGGGEIENRDYLDIYDRVWSGGATRGSGISNVLTNAYPYSNPVLTDDGGMFLYISDNNNADALETVVSYAVKNGSGYEDMGAIDTAEGMIPADSDVVVSGTGNNVFAAWVKQMETPDKEMHAAATYDDLGMMMNATEVYAGTYNNGAWTVERLTENSIADMAPTVASSGNKAIVAWRSLAATSMPEENGTDDLTAMFNAENNINYRIYNGSSWTEAQVAYNGSAGTVSAVDAAMLSDGTSLLTYTVRTGEENTSTETFYTVIGTNGEVITTGRLTNDDYTDTNVQVAAVGNQFVLGWYSEHEAGEEGATDETVVAHDVRLARINANGSIDAAFPESLGGDSDSTITADFRFSAPANCAELDELSIVWSQRKDTENVDDSGKYELKAVRFYEDGDTIGVTLPMDIAETGKNVAVDHFDTYTDANGAVRIILLDSDYSSMDGIEVFDTIDLTNLTEVNNVPGGDADEDHLQILSQEPVANIALASATFPETAVDVKAKTDLGELMPGLDLPVQFTVKNTGTSKITTVAVNLGGVTENVNGLSLNPGESAVVTMTYPVPESAVSDVDYTVTANGSATDTGTLKLNRPTISISGVKLVREENGERDIQVNMSSGSNVPFANSGRIVKLAFYLDGNCTQRIGNAMEIPASAYQDIDDGIYSCVTTLNVSDIIGAAEEIPEDGVRVYARAWVEDANERAISNDVSFVSFKGLLTKNNGQMTSEDVMLDVNADGSYTVYAKIRNNSLQPVTTGFPVAVLLDGEGNVLAQKNLQDDILQLDGEGYTPDLTASFTAAELNGAVPAQAAVRYAYKVTFDANGAEGAVDYIQAELDGSFIAPDKGNLVNQDLVFYGWNTNADGTGDGCMSGDTFTVTGNTTFYAQWGHVHNWSFSYNESNKTFTATCSDTCGVGTQTLKFNDILSKFYDGQAFEPSCTRSAGWIEENDLPESPITYIKEGASYSEAIDAGTYTIHVSLGNGALEQDVGEFTITPKLIAIIADDKEMHDGEAEPELTVTLAQTGNLRFENDPTYPWQIFTEGNRVCAKAGNQWVDSSTSRLTLRVKLLEETTISFDYRYAKEKWDKGYFKVDGSTLFEGGNYTQGWTTVSYTLTAGEHTLEWSYTKDYSFSDYEDLFAVDNIRFSFPVTQSDSIPASDALTEALNYLQSAVVEGDTLNFTVSHADYEDPFEYPTLVPITVTPGENPNYSLTPVEGTLTILESLGEHQTIVADDVTATYGDTDARIEAAITEGDGTLRYVVRSGDDVVSVDANGNLTILKTGTAVVSVIASKTESYAKTIKYVNVTVNPKPITDITETVQKYPFDGDSHGIAVTITDPADGYTVMYGTEEGVYDLNESPTLTEEGTLIVYYQVTADNYATLTGRAMLKVGAHFHEFTYVVGTGEDANTITATCSEPNCGLENNTAILTINAPADLGYTGSAIAAVLTDPDGIRELNEVVYYAADAAGERIGEALLGAPVNVGRYWAQITIGEGGNTATAHVVYEIVYRVSFNLNGGTGEFDPVLADLEGHIVIPANEPTPPNRTPAVFFRGWYTEANGGELVTEDTVFTENSTVYARYTPHEHVFSYQANGDTVTATCVSTVNDVCTLEEQNRQVSLTINAPSRTVQLFGSNYATITGDTSVLGTPQIVYYAANEAGERIGEALSGAPTELGRYWAEFTLGEGENSATAHVVYEFHPVVSFNVNGGSGNIESVNTDINGHIVIPADEPTAPEMTPAVFFRGWYTEANGGELVTAETVFTVDSTVYARYTPHEHVFSYEANGDTVIATCVSTVNDVCTLEEQNRQVSLTIHVPERAGQQYGNHHATVTGDTAVLGTPEIVYYASNEAGEKIGDALSGVPDQMGWYWAEFTLGEGVNSATGHVVYELIVSVVESPGIMIHDFARVTDPNAIIAAVNDSGWHVSHLQALAWIYANADMINSNSNREKYVVFGGSGEYLIYYSVWNTNGAIGSAINRYGGYVYDVANYMDYYDVYFPTTDEIKLPEGSFTNVTDQASLNAATAAMPNGTELDAIAWMALNENTLLSGQTQKNIIFGKTEDGSYKCFFYNNGNVYGPQIVSAADVASTPFGEGISIYVIDTVGVLVPSLNDTFTVTYNSNGASGTLPEGGTYYYGVGVTVGSGENLTNQDLHFEGWNTKRDGTGESYAAGDTLTVSGNTTLYAMWRHYHNWNVTYNAGNKTFTATCTGTCPVGTQTIRFDTSDRMYNGSAVALYTIGAGWTEANGLPMPTVVCYKDGEEVSEVKDAGTYSAHVSLGDYEIDLGEFRITPRPVLIIPDDAEMHNGDNDPEFTVTFEPMGTGHRYVNDEHYPWIIVTEGDRTYVKSGNEDINNSLSALTLTVTLLEAGTVSFDYMYGSESGWDKCYFHVDSSQKFELSGDGRSWRSYSCNLSAGTHTLKWTYTKDRSSADYGDFYAVDNVKITAAVTQAASIPVNEALTLALKKIEGGLVEGETINCTVGYAAFEAPAAYPITVPLTVIPGENPNYAVQTQEGILTVLAPEEGTQWQTISAEDMTVTYGDTNARINASITEGDGTLSYKVNSGSDVVSVDANGSITTLKVGSAVIAVIASKTDSYLKTTKLVAVTVAARPITDVTRPVQNKGINGQPQGITVTITDPAEGYTVKYGVEEGVYPLDDSPTLTDEGTTTVYYQVTAENYITCTGSVTLNLRQHIHSFTYEPGATADTIVATCSEDGCYLDNHQTTLTIAAPDDLTYTGSGIAAVITDPDNIQEANVIYYAADESGEKTGEALTGAPVNVGRYWAEITLGEDNNTATAHVVYDITKANPTATAPTPTATYGQTLADVTLTNPTGNTEGTWVWVDESTTSVGTVGSHTFLATFTPEDTDNYNILENIEVTVTVNKAPNPAEIGGTPEVPKGGYTIDLADFVTMNGATGDVTYAISGNANGCSISGSVLTTGTTGDVTVTVLVSVATDDNYLALAATPLTVTILNQIDQHITVSDVTATYGDTGVVVEAETDGNGALSYEVTSGTDVVSVDSEGNITILNVGSAVITVTAAETNLYFEATATVNVTVGAMTLTVTAVAQEKTYGEEDPELTYTYSDLAYDDDDSVFTGALTRADGQNVSTYAITQGTLSAGDNYEIDFTGADLTINAKTLYVTADAKEKTYGEDDPNLTFTYSDLAYDDDDSVFTGALTRADGQNVGTYAITQGTLSAGDNYVIDFTGAELTINQRPLTLTAENKEKLYNAADPELTAVPGENELVEGDSLNYTLSREEGTDVGDYTISITLGENPNYDITTVNGILTINPADLTINDNNKPVAVEDLVYNYEDQTLIAAPESLPIGETGYAGCVGVEYSLDEETWSDERPTALHAGEYTVYVHYIPDSNHNEAFAQVTASIAKKPVDPTVYGLAKVFTYDGTAHTPTIKLFDPTMPDPLTLIPAENYTVTYIDNIHAGEATVQIRNTEDGDYIINKDAEFHILPLEIDLTADNKTKVYGEDDPTLTATPSELVAGDVLVYTVTRAEGENVGQYLITVSVTADANPDYEITAKTGVFTITAKGVTVTADDISKTYGEDDPELTVTIDGLVNNEPESLISYTVNRAEGENAGEYVITVTGDAEQGNYAVTFVNGTFTVDPAPVTVTAEDKTKVYGEDDPEFTATVTGLVNNEPESLISYTLSRAEGENVGEYTITPSGEAVQGNYSVTYVNGKLTINRASVTVTAENKTKVYGEDDPTLTWTVEGLEFSDTADVLNVNISRAAGQNVDEYAITVSGDAEQGNYSVTYVGGTFTITRASVTVTADDLSKVYGEDDPTLTWTADGLKYNDTASVLTVTIERAEGENVGEYTITVSGDAEQGNYNVTFAEGTFTITRASVTVTADNLSKVYGEDDPTLTWTVDGLKYTDTKDLVTVSISRAEGENVGDYVITVSGDAEQGNYSVTYVNGTFTITKAEITVTAEDKTKTYGEDDPELTWTVDGLQNGDTEDVLTVDISRAAGQNVGDYAITVSGDAEQGNYSVTYVNGKLTINRASVTVTAENKTKVYGEDDPELTWTVEGLQYNDNANLLSVNISRAEGRNVGDYDITVSGDAEQGNYFVTFENGTFTITRASVTVTADDLGKVYGAADPTLTWTADGLKYDDTEDVLTVSIERAEGENVGEYTITVSGDAEQGNYTVSFENGTFTITSAEITVTAANKTKTYGEDDPTLTWTVEGLANGDTEDVLSVSISRAEGENVGDYAITVSGDAEQGNYTVTYVNGTVTITKASVTVTADDQTKTYGDDDPTLTWTAEGLTNGDTEDVLSVSISRAEGQNVGDYAITVSGDAEQGNYSVTYVNGTFTIDKANVTVTAEDKSKTFGEDDPTLTWTVDGLKYTDTASILTVAISRAEGENAGEYAITVSGDAEQGNYSVTYVNGTFTIDPLAITPVVFLNTTVSFVYTGTAWEPDVIVYYETESGSVMIPEDQYTLEYSNNINYGTAAVTVTAVDGGNYAFDPATGNFFINRARVTVTADDKTKTYGDDDPTFTFTAVGLVGSDTADVLNCEFTRAEGENVGEYAITISGAKFQGNYQVSYVSGKLTIECAAVTVTADDASKTYNDPEPAEFTATVSGMKNDEPASLIVYTVSREAGENAGTYAIIPTGDAEQGNYTVTYVNGTFTVDPLAVTVNITGHSSTVDYDGQEHSVSGYDVEISDTLYTEADFTFSGSAEAVRTDAGTTEMGLDANDFENTNANFEVTFEVEDGSLTINPIDVTVTITGANNTAVYDGQEHSVSGYTFEPSTALYTENDFTFSGTAEAAQTNVGTASMGLAADQFANTSANFASVTFEVTDGYQTVTKKAASINAVDSSKVYGEDDPTLTANVTGAVEGETLNYTLTRAEGENAGTYAITVNLGENPNYEITTTGATFTITKKGVTVTADAKEKEYGEDDPTLTWTVDGLVDGDEASVLNISISRAEGQTVGTYTITVTGDAEQGNYTITAFNNSTLTINKAPVTVTADDQTMTFQGDEPELSVTITGLKYDDTEDLIAYTIEREPGTNAGEYAITVTGVEDQGNYTVSFEDGTFTIEPAVIDNSNVSIVIESGTFTYDGTEKKPRVMVFIDGVRINASEYSVEYSNNVNAGTATITLVDNDGGNYDVSGSSSFLIWPKEITVTADDIVKHYGETDPELTATVEGLVGTDTVEYTLTREAGEDVGKYLITASGRNYQGNYLISFVNGTFAIECEEPIVTFRTVELREHGTDDGKVDIRYLFKVQLNDTKVNYLGQYYNGTQDDNRFELTSLAVIFVRSDVDPAARYIVNCSNIFSMHAEAETPYFEYTAFVNNIDANMMSWVFSAYARVGYGREGEETQYVYSEETEAMSFGDLIDSIANN